MAGEKLSVLVVGCGNMGTSHARAYHKMDEFEIVGLVSRTPASRERLSEELGGLPMYGDFHEALKATSPDVVDLYAIGYKYSKKKVLHFIMTPGAGSTAPGEPYQVRYSDSFGNTRR